MAQIIYGGIAEHGEVLASHCATSDNRHEKVIDVLLQRISSTNQKKAYVYDGYSYNYVLEDSTVYLCAADSATETRICFAYLDAVMKRYDGNSEGFDSVLEELMNYYNHDPKADKIKGVKEQIAQVKGVMLENIESVLKRGEKIEEVLAKTDVLRLGSTRFRTESNKAKNRFWWKNVKLCICILVLLFILVAIIVVIIVILVKTQGQ